MRRVTQFFREQPDRWQTPLALIAILAVVCLVYARGIDAPMFFDDDGSVRDNESIRGLWPLSRHLEVPQGRPTAGRPLVNYSLALNYRFGDLTARSYHVVNVALHAASAMLLFAIVRRVLIAKDYHGAVFMVALLAAMVWAVHPLNTEAVEYVSQRTELMMAFFYLATVYCSLRYWNRRGIAWLVLAALSCFAGMACKESMVTAPVVVLLLERAVVGGSWRQILRRSWPLYLALALSWTVLLLLNVGGPRSDSAGFHLDVTASQWWLTQCQVLWMYFKLAAWPWPLVIHYKLPYLQGWSDSWMYVLPTLALLLFTIVALWKNWLSGFLAAAMLFMLSPTLVVPIVTEIAAERRMYLPLALLVAWVVAALAHVAARHRAGTWSACVAAAAVVAMFVFLSAKRVELYNDELALWEDALRYQPNNSLVNDNLAEAYKAQGMHAEAVHYFEEALRLRPEKFHSYHQLANCYAELQRHDEAIATAVKALAKARANNREEEAVSIRIWLDDYRVRLKGEAQRPKE